MSKTYWVRLVMMVLALGVVIAAIRYLNPSTPAAPRSAGGKSFEPLAPLKGTYNLCPTRVAWLQVPASGVRVEDNHSKWFRLQNGQPQHPRQEVDTIAVEKWLSVFCSALTREVAAPAAAPASTPGGAAAAAPTQAAVLEIGYISGPSQLLVRESLGDFILQGHHFVSKELDEALRTLPNLPAARSPGAP